MAERDKGDEGLSNRDRSVVRMRSISNYVMGVLLIGAGCFFFFPTQRTAPFLNQYDSSMIRIFAIICWIYGIFRIYRGYRKNYFREY